jgi:hypothetical protein
MAGLMPYIVTTKRPAAGPTFVSRRAVATLDGRYCPQHGLTRDEHCRASLGSDGQGAVFCQEATRPLPESGGTVGPLPDGTVIEVEQVGWADLAWRAGRTAAIVPPDPSPCQPGWQTILDAYNARQT